jgi:hypothetical protein
MNLDAVVAIAVAALCAAWLVARTVRSLRGPKGPCGCGKPVETPCPGTSAILDAARAGAARRRGATPSR